VHHCAAFVLAAVRAAEIRKKRFEFELVERARRPSQDGEDMIPHENGHRQTMQCLSVQPISPVHSERHQLSMKVLRGNASERNCKDPRGTDSIDFENASDSALHCERLAGSGAR
jgi:hypothetical protein